MSTHTSIEWTDHTFNIAWGCMKVSPGCANCYAETWAKWTHKERVWGPAATTPRRVFGEKHWAEPLEWNALAEHEGGRRRVFCSSMADVFEDHPTIDAERSKLWPLIRATPWLDWQILTKRPERIAANLPDDWGEGYPNVWLGTSIESPEYLPRFDALRAVPAAVHFLSLEPLLAQLSLYDHIASLGYNETWWAIVGGESGPGARPMRVEWIESIAADCWEFDVPLFVKQMGARPVTSNPKDWNCASSRLADESGWALHLRDKKGGNAAEWPEHLRVREFPTSAVRV